MRTWWRNQRRVTPDDPMVMWHPNPVGDLDVASYLSDLPVGVIDGETSDQWLVTLADMSTVLIGGRSLTGKSRFIHGLVGHLAAHPHIEISFVDLYGGLEASLWRDRVSAMATRPNEAMKLVSWLVSDCKARYQRMRAQKVENVWETPGFLGPAEPVRVLVVDETQALLRDGADTEVLQQATENLRELASLGRAAGYMVILATENPVMNLPANIRDFANVEVMFRCLCRSEAFAILGEEVLSVPASLAPDYISHKLPGMAVTWNIGELMRVRSAYISDEQIAVVAAGPWTGTQWSFLSEEEA